MKLRRKSGEINKIIILIVIIIGLIWGFKVADNISQHLEIATNFVQYSLWVPFHIILPVILFGSSLVHKRRKLTRYHV